MTIPSDWFDTHGFPLYHGRLYEPQSSEFFYNPASHPVGSETGNMSNANHNTGRGPVPGNGTANPEDAYNAIYPGNDAGFGMNYAGMYNPYTMTPSYSDVMRSYQQAYGMTDKDEELDEKEDTDDDKEEQEEEGPYMRGFSGDSDGPRGAPPHADKKGKKAPRQQHKQQQQEFSSMYDPQWMMMYYPLMYGYPSMMQQREEEAKANFGGERWGAHQNENMQNGASSTGPRSRPNPYQEQSTKPGKGGDSVNNIPDPPSYWSLFNPYMTSGLNYPLGTHSGDSSDSGVEKNRKGFRKGASQRPKNKTGGNTGSYAEEMAAYEKWYDYWQKLYGIKTDGQHTQQKRRTGRRAGNRKAGKEGASGEMGNVDAMKDYYDAWMKAYMQGASNIDEDKSDDDEGGDNNQSRKTTSSGLRSGYQNKKKNQTKKNGMDKEFPNSSEFSHHYMMYYPWMTMPKHSPMNAGESESAREKHGWERTSLPHTRPEKSKGARVEKSDHSNENSGSDTVHYGDRRPPAGEYKRMYHPMMMPYFGMTGESSDDENGYNDGNQRSDQSATQTNGHQTGNHSTDSGARIPLDGDVVRGDSTEENSTNYDISTHGSGEFEQKGKKSSVQETNPYMKGWGGMSKKQQKEYEEMMAKWYKSYAEQFERQYQGEDDAAGQRDGAEGRSGLDHGSENDADTEGNGSLGSTDGTTNGEPQKDKLQHLPASMVLREGDQQQHQPDNPSEAPASDTAAAE